MQSTPLKPGLLCSCLQGFNAATYLGTTRTAGAPFPDKPNTGAIKIWPQNSNKLWLTTPKVTAVAREYFSCKGAIGAPLEDGGPGGLSAQSHFKYLLMHVSSCRVMQGKLKPD